MKPKYIAAFAAVVAVRLATAPSVFAVPSPYGFGVPGGDEWVHVHRARAFAETGEVPRPDPAFAAPEGLAIHWPVGYDAALGWVWRLFGPRALPFVPLLGSLAGAAAVALGAQRLGLSPPLAVAVWAVVPAGFFTTAVGALDHHAFETAFFWLPALLVARRPILAGAILGLSFHVVTIAPVSAVVFLLAALASGRGGFGPSGEDFENGVLVATAVAFPAGLERAAFDAPSLLGFLVFAGAGFLVAALLTRAAVTEGAGDGAARGRVHAAAILLGATALPLFELVAKGGAYLRLRDPWLTTVAEARPLVLPEWRTWFQAVSLMTPGVLFLPALLRRGGRGWAPPEIFVPTVCAAILTLLQVRSANFFSPPAAWGLVLLAFFMRRFRKAGPVLAAALLLPSLRPIAEAAERFAPAIPDAYHRAIRRAGERLPEGAIVLARWDLAPYLVALADCRTVADGFHRNAAGRRFFRNVLLAPPEKARVLLDKRRVDAVLLTPPEDGFLASLDPARAAGGWRGTFAAALAAGSAYGWKRVVEEDGVALYVRGR